VREVLDFIGPLARAAGERLLAGMGRLTAGQIDFKGRRDMVTAVDRDIEAFIAARILATFPDDAVLAEEAIRRDGTSGRVWIVDPLDGTTNFVHGHPMVCVSVALADGYAGLPAGDGADLGPAASGFFRPGNRPRLLAGVVHAPVLGETFLAERGGGARLNDRRIQVSRESDVARSLVATGFAYRLHELANSNLGNFGRVALIAQGVRRGGSAALDLAYVAAGRFDAFWELYLKPWDVAAGMLLVEEAGGRVTDCAGGLDAHEATGILATNGLVHGPMVALLEGPDPAWAAAERARLFGEARDAETGEGRKKQR
jgi:myo-inositol-1(or 4)-monophosphatase